MRWVLALVALLLACSSSPEVSGWPWWPVASTSAVDKVDLLLAIDNSPSMADKQDLLALAVPMLVNRLLNPNCVATATSGPSSTCKAASDCSSLGAGADCDTAGNGGSGQCFVPGDGKGGALQCSTIPNTKPEFQPVYDMHIGIVSSSLGGGGSPDMCVPSSGDPTHQDDKGHLLNRTMVNVQDGPPINDAKPVDGNGGNFLAWLPASDPKNQGKTPPNVTPYVDPQPAQLVTDFQSLVQGVQQRGCGLEAQLESWYRFLVQPDPWDSIQMSSDNPPRASYSGVDATLLKMRHDFLRPDSLVAIIQLTDEEDSWSDPLWLGGYGWTARTLSFPGGPGQGAGPRGTSECDQPEDINNPTTWGPNNPDCMSCAFPGSNKPVSGTPIGEDPNCNACAGGQSTCPQKGWWTPASTAGPVQAMDGLNVRYGNQTMRTRYGFDNQHHIQRYVDALRLTTVPDRDHEAHDYQQYATGTQRNCTNPLFATDLPDGSDTSPGALCNLRLGPRTPDRVFYALIGGLPSSLVDDANGKLKIDLSPDDWTKIVGKDPEHYIFDGIDPHMIESTAPRPGLSTAGTAYDLGTDPANGREWNTLTSGAGIDLQYACTFDLPSPKDCTLAANKGACDCDPSSGSTTTAPDGPPLCSTQARTTQVKGKAYPTIRELRVAKGLGSRAVVASLCAKVVTGSTSDSAFGYNPAIRAIVDRLRPALSGSCLKSPLPTINGESGCLMFVTFPNDLDQSTACNAPGLSQPPASMLERYRSTYEASLGADGGIPVPSLCVLQQLATCTSPDAGWCYETNTDGCAQKIDFSSTWQAPSGTQLSLECTASVTN